MSIRSIDALQRHLRRLGEQAVPTEDAILLDRFVAANDREAFAQLIARHGPMVLGTARRLVGNRDDADDVFQAVFLSLARLAKTIRRGRALPAWLHRTTCRVAAKLRARRPVQSALPAERCEHVDPSAGLVWREVCQALDEELQRLPERLRAPLLLCYLSGLTRDEAARQLGWSLGTLKRRLEQGRNILRIRLERRGIAAVGLALTVLTPEALRAAVSTALVESSLNLIFATGIALPATITALAVSSAGTMKGVVMKCLLALLATIALGVGIYAATGRADPPEQAATPAEVRPAKDGVEAAAPEDPLPKGSTLRFGTDRFRHGIPVSTMAISADGKLAVAVNGNHILGAMRVFDLVSGRALYTLGGSEGTAIDAAAISPDGRTLITRQNFSLRIRDAATGQELRKIDLPRANRYSRTEWIAFTPDGKAIAATSQGDVVYLIDVASGTTIRDFSNANPESSLGPDWASVLGIAFAPDGKRMASGGFVNDKGNYFARLWDVQTGKELRRFMHGKTSYGIPSLAFSPDAKMLATRAHDGRLRLFDVETGKLERTFPPDGGGRRLGTVAFSQDGKTVAAGGDALRLYDVATGEERLRIDRKQATGLTFTDGGKTLTGAVMGAIYRWDTATGKVMTPEAGDSVVEQIIVSPDGRRGVTCGQNGDAHIWDGTNGQHLRAVNAAWQRGLAMSPDGRFLVWSVADAKVQFTEPQEPNTIYHGSRLRQYDIAAGKLVDRFPPFKGDAHDLTFTDGGKKLVTVDHRNGMVFIWDVETAKEARSFQAVPDAENKHPNYVWRTALSPDGKTLAVAQEARRDLGRLGLRSAPHVVRLWDLADGRLKHTLNGHRSYVLDMAFSPDGRLLATCTGAAPVFVWDAATGSRVTALPVGATAVAFSRDGRLLATAIPEGAIRLWEVATWTVRTEFTGHRDRPTVVTFAPGGTLLSGSVDTTVLAWAVRPPRVALAVPLERAWHDLAAHDAGALFKTEGRFLAAPAATVKLFAAKIKPATALDPRRIERLLADLGSDTFDVREAATQTLRGLDEQAIPYLDRTLKTAASLEVRRRVEQLLDERRKAPIGPERLRRLRAVMVLETIGDDAAQQLLRRWAVGPAGARLTMEASAALRRWHTRSPGKR